MNIVLAGRDGALEMCTREYRSPPDWPILKVHTLCRLLVVHAAKHKAAHVRFRQPGPARTRAYVAFGPWWMIAWRVKRAGVRERVGTNFALRLHGRSDNFLRADRRREGAITMGLWSRIDADAWVSHGTGREKNEASLRKVGFRVVVIPYSNCKRRAATIKDCLASWSFGVE